MLVQFLDRIFQVEYIDNSDSGDRFTAPYKDVEIISAVDIQNGIDYTKALEKMNKLDDLTDEVTNLI